MISITVDSLGRSPTCPKCVTVFPTDRILQGNKNSDAIAYCKNCGATVRLILPKIEKKLLYLDQSFFSDVLQARDKQDDSLQEQRLFGKLLKLKSLQKIFVVVSDIHSAETSAIPENYAEKRSALWQLQNKLAEGRIAGNYRDIFIAQQRRKLKFPTAPDEFPSDDIGLKDPFRLQIGMQVMLTNSWRLRLHRETVASRECINGNLKSILERQVQAVGIKSSIQDCLTHIRGSWRQGLLDGISALRQRKLLLAAITDLLSSPDEQKALNQLLMSATAPFSPLVTEIIEGLSGDALDELEKLLGQDPCGGCPSVRIHTAMEAELLSSWCQGFRKNIKRFNENYGLSRLNDVGHLSTFLPYVDALTTDNDMANLCRRETVVQEIDKTGCQIFSKSSYSEFESWLDGI